MENITTAPQKSRLLSLDAFRGITIAAMIIVNTPGNQEAYKQLDHAEWNGCTMTDLVFPFFLFIVGVSLVFSLSKRLERDGGKGLAPQIFKRTLIIYALGMVLNAIPNYHPSTIRILGVLQRIALCYCAASFIFIKTTLRAQIAIAACALVGYWLVMTQIPVPGYGAGILTKEGSLASWLDRLVLGAHTYRQGVYDPEGILSTIPALVTTMFGIFTGLWLRSARTAGKKTRGLMRAGALMFITGWLWSLSFPLNKALWTSSYVLYTGGLALWLLALCYWLIEIRDIKAWSKPFEIFGINAIAAYMLPIFLLKFLVLYKLNVPGGEPVQLRIFICDHIFGTWLSPLNASAAFAFSYMALWLGFFWLLYRRNIFIKI
ncbi:MAG: heparan-alpha-glucosaminide N-acetyltransferase domain-containing protein [Elusimicrobia bacterium]|nr:heparan-alpha-glucosaminide N-acetyltransferase domain-containing protein [Elusimicrobiota bacterium]